VPRPYLFELLLKLAPRRHARYITCQLLKCKLSSVILWDESASTDRPIRIL
jgi:hypothetical protein